MTKKNKILSNIRVTSELYEKMLKGLNSMNDNSDVEFTLGDFRRLAYKFFSEHVLTQGVKFVVSVKV